MPITKQFDSTKILTTFKCDGDLSFREIVGSMKDFYGGIDNPPTKKLIWNLRNATIWSLTMEELKAIAQLSVENEGLMKGGKTAVVAPKDIDFGLARIYQAHTVGSERELMVFRTLDEAKEWMDLESNETL